MSNPKYLMTVLCAVVVVTGCQVVDKTADDPITHCPIHNVKLKTSLVRITYGLPSPNLVQAAEIKDDLFPYAKVPILSGCMMRKEKYSKVWVCSECCKARKAWLKKPREVPEKQTEIEVED